MNVLEKILEEIKEKCVELSKNHWGYDECHLVGKGIQSMYIQTEKIIRSYMDETPFTNVESNIDEMASVDSAIKILKNMQNPKIDYADMVGAPAFCYGKSYVFQDPEDYAIEAALIALHEKKERNMHGNNDSDINNKCSECSRRKQYMQGYEDGKKEDGWITYTSQNMPKKEDVYLVTCDDEEYPVKRMRFKKEYGLWYDDRGIYDGVILAWQPLPEPYKPNKDNSATEHIMSRFMKVE